MSHYIAMGVLEPLRLHLSTGSWAQQSEEQDGEGLAWGINANGFRRNKQSS